MSRGRIVALLIGLVAAFVPAASASASLRSAAASSVPTARQRGDVRRLLAPIAALRRAVRPHATAVAQAITATQTADRPCLQQARSGIRAAKAAGSLSASDASDARNFVEGLAAVDVLQVVFKPLDREMSSAWRSYRMHVGDRVLRAGARAEARQLRALLRLGRARAVDFCGMTTPPRRPWLQARCGVCRRCARRAGPAGRPGRRKRRPSEDARRAPNATARDSGKAGTALRGLPVQRLPGRPDAEVGAVVPRLHRPALTGGSSAGPPTPAGGRMTAVAGPHSEPLRIPHADCCQRATSVPLVLMTAATRVPSFPASPRTRDREANKADGEGEVGGGGIHAERP